MAIALLFYFEKNIKKSLHISQTSLRMSSPVGKTHDYPEVSI